jgi:glycosyltransferase involved in cell wall biosynthesis
LGYNILMEKTRILFISRAYPPVVGGIESHNYELSRWLGRITKVKTIANKHGRKFLPVFAPIALIKTLVLLPFYDVVLLGDGVLAFIGWFVKLISKKPVISVVHGLDINYNSPSLGVWYERFLVLTYQSFWTKLFIPKLDKLIAVGNETIKTGMEHGIPAEKFVFIPNGVDTEKNLTDCSRKDLEKIIGKSVDGKKILLTSGRLAKRKGVAWFVANVMPKLSEDFLYIIAGNGPDKKNIGNSIKNNHQENRVIILGFVPDATRNILLNTADLFVQPNIKVPGDMEGFGISVIEAGACKLPVLASNIEGLKDAIKDNSNGFLVESENAAAFIEKINELFLPGNPRDMFGQKARDYVIQNFSWEHIAKRYLEEIKKTVDKNS